MKKATSAFKQNLIYKWLESNNPAPSDLAAALKWFSLSCCGYTVAMYILGIGDRHNDNIMLKKNGEVYAYQIVSSNLCQSCFILTSDM